MRQLLLVALSCLLLIIARGSLMHHTEAAVQLGQPTGTPTVEAARTKVPYTSYSGYYRIRCWPGCHTKNLPESIKRSRLRATPTATIVP